MLIFSCFKTSLRARSVAASYKPPMLVTRVRLPACAISFASGSYPGEVGRSVCVCCVFAPLLFGHLRRLPQLAAVRCGRSHARHIWAFTFASPWLPQKHSNTHEPRIFIAHTPSKRGCGLVCKADRMICSSMFYDATLFAQAAVAQLAARRSHNPKVGSSILSCRMFEHHAHGHGMRLNCASSKKV